MDQLDTILELKEKLNPPRSAQLTEQEKKDIKREMIQSYQAQGGAQGLPQMYG